MKRNNTLDNKKLDSTVNYSEFINIQEAYCYINVLKQKFNIKTTEISENEKFAFNKNVFRVIGIKNKNVVEKDKFLFLELIT